MGRLDVLVVQVTLLGLALAGVGLAATIPPPFSDPVNCRDRGECDDIDCGDGTCLGRLRDYIAKLDPSVRFQDGEYIACIQPPSGPGGICAYYQHLNGTEHSAGRAGGYIEQMFRVGCKSCGSATLPPAANESDVSNYQLSVGLNPEFRVDYVSQPCPHGGFCP